MTTPMKPLFMREKAMHFFEETVVHSMEGMLFALLSALFTIAGAMALLEDFEWRDGAIGMTAAAPAAPTPPATAQAQPRPERVAVIEHAAYVLPAR